MNHHHRALLRAAISARSRRLRRQHHHRALSSSPFPAEESNETQRCRRARSGSEASPSFRRLVGVFTARSTSRGFHATTGTRLIEDRDGRGLTEEIIEENLVSFLLSCVGRVSFSRSLFVFVLARVCSKLELFKLTNFLCLFLLLLLLSRTKKRRTENEAKR